MENAVARAEGALKGTPDGGAPDARSNTRVIDVVAVRYGFEIPSEQDGAIARLSASREKEADSLRCEGMWALEVMSHRVDEALQNSHRNIHRRPRRWA